MFALRSPHETIFYTSGEMVQFTIAVDDQITLRSGDQSVLIRVVNLLDPNRFSGIIYGFEPGHAIEHNGLELNQHIEFAENQIFGVTKN